MIDTYTFSGDEAREFVEDFKSLYDAKDDALVWSVELNGENVVVYEAVENDFGYKFNPLDSIFS